MTAETTIEVRRLRPQDDAALQALHARINADVPATDGGEPVPLARYRAMLEDPAYFVLAARAGQDWVGWAIAITIRRWRQDKLFLYEVDVVENARRRGVGRCLIEAVLAIARERGMALTFVMTSVSNVAAMGLYRSTGARRPNDDDVLLAWWDA